MLRFIPHPRTVLLVAALGFVPGQSLASETPDEPFGMTTSGTLEILVMRQPLRELLGDIAREAGLRTNLANEVRGVVKRQLINGTFEEAMNDLSERNNFEWFIYLDTVFVSMQNRQETHMFTFNSQRAEDVLEVLQAEIPTINRFNVKALRETNSISLTGPKELIEIIGGLAATILPEPQATASNFATVTVRRGTDTTTVSIK